MRMQPGLYPLFTLVFVILLSNCSAFNPVEPIDPVHTRDTDPLQAAEQAYSTATPQHSPGLPSTAGLQQVAGVVISGGDQTPEGLLGGPRIFAYQVQLDSGEVITLTYTAYPPSPAGDAEPKPQLNFENGIISPGDRVIAQGTFDPATQILSVEAETDFIETFAK